MLLSVKKSLLVIAGVVSLALGIVGAFLPLLPTVPLVLLSAFCFARSSERLHQWLLNHRVFGRIIRDFEAGRGVERRIKLRAIVLIWISMTASSLMLQRPMVYLVLGLIGLAVSWNIWRLPEPVRAGTPSED
ncbi:MAG: YbaN family protein [Pseudomonadales bacterium]|nr:YbaN family protein [Pseudomonadales bacterium]